jgi:hypothetical protein
MRFSIAFILILFVFTSTFAADNPIPQDAARMEKRARERLAWNRRTVGDAYDKVGKRNPKWDKSAREALDLAARMFAQQGDPPISLADIYGPAKKAVDAGCDDPLVLYLYARSSTGPNAPKPEEYQKRFQTAATAMAASSYPPIRRAVALLMATDAKTLKKDLSPTERKEILGGLESVLDLLSRSAVEDQRGFDWEEGWDRNLRVLLADYRRLEGNSKAAFDALDAQLAKVKGIEALRLTFKGEFLIKWAWEARTTAFAPGVSDQQFQTFTKRSQEARTALEAAWKLNANQPYVAQRMLVVEKSIGGGDRQAMETWFERAMQADGNDREACWSKLDWLDPKWYGGESTDAMMAFGKACRATGNWHNGITLLVADAHLRHSGTLERGARAKYFFTPEVHAEIVEIFEDHLKHYPSDDVERSKYAVLCYMGGYIGQAHKQFQILGDRLTPWPAFPSYNLETMQKFRDDAAKKMAAHQGGNVPAKP